MHRLTARERLRYNAQVAEEVERWDDMFAATTELAQLQTQLTLAERNLFAVSVKKTLGAKRRAWRLLSAIEEAGDLTEARETQTAEYRIEIAKELKAGCEEAQTLLADYLIPNDVSPTGSVLYLKLSADLHRYLAEIADFPMKERYDSAMAAQSRYDDAVGRADRLGLPTAHAIRLGLMLNYSIFLNEVMNDTDRANSMATRAHDAAVDTISQIEEDDFRDAVAALERLKENLLIWNEDPHEGEVSSTESDSDSDDDSDSS